MIQNIGHIGAFAPAAKKGKTVNLGPFVEVLRQSIRGEKSAPATDTANGTIELGKISDENPTVSHLLTGHPEYRDDCWEIVHSDINSGKPFRNLPVGRAVSLDPKTGEIFCCASDEASVRANPEKRDIGYRREAKVRVASKTEDTSTLPEPRAANAAPADSLDLAGALRPYIGTPYSEINCFELVVEGLKDLGIAYGGRRGMQDTLIRKALDRGLPMNAYLTGEGLIDVSATKVYEGTLSKAGHSKTQARQVLDDMRPILETGLILSFSTETRGHTGIVAKQGRQWTFLNSGRLDNEISPSPGKKGVGEEVLEAEIANWLRLAGRRGESLKITAGRLDSRKIVSFLNPSQKSNANHRANNIKTSA